MKKIFITISTFIILSPILCFGSTIKIKDIVVSSSPLLLFQDIAIFKDDTKDFSKIKNIPILNMQPLGSHIILSREDIKKLLKIHFSKEFLSILEIPDRVHVYKGKMLLSKNKLISMIINFIKDNGLSINGDLRVRDINVPNYIVLKEGENIELQMANVRLKPGYNSINFVIKKDGHKVRSWPGRFFLDVYAPIPCAKRPLNIGEKITFDKITFVKKNLAYLPKAIWDGKGGPYRVKIPIGAMQPITMDRIEPLPAIVRGQKVKLVFDGESIYLKTIGRALEDGKIGDTIGVLNLQSKRIVYGMIANKDTVKVE